MKLCECGCGQPAPITTTTNTAGGNSLYVVGQSKRFIRGHNKAQLRHGATGSPEYQAFQDAKRRCRNPNNDSWKYYGGRGIKFCFSSFEEFIAEVGPKPSPKHSLDRYPDNNGNYEPGNVRWATGTQQRLNQRPYRPSGGAGKPRLRSPS